MNMHAEDETTDIEKLYEDTLYRIASGRIIKGKIVSKRSDDLIVDVGYKSEGVVPISEFTADEIANLNEGDEIEVFIERINDKEGIVILSRDRASKIRTWELLSKAYNHKALVEGIVIGKTKGGLFVDVYGIKAFLPASQIDIKIVRDKEMDAYIGKSLQLKILKLTTPKGQFSENQIAGASVVVSRRAVIEEERMRQKEETLKIIKEGAILKGVVKNITDYGVFVDLGGIDGLLHISDISWRRVNHPSEFFKIGDVEEFIVLKFDGEAEKVTLGYKQKISDPWLTVDEKYKEGMKLKGRVMNITDYGIFVEVEQGLEGLIHVSEIDWNARPKHPSKYVSVGEEVEAMVIGVNKDERRLSLSIRNLKPKPWQLVGENYKVGQKITGKVKTLTDFGTFVRLPEGVDGLIHISDFSWTKHIKHPSELLKKGQKIEAVILSMEPEKERMALGIKQLTPDPWIEEIPAKYRLGDEFKGRILKITDFGIFVELKDGVEGLVYSSEVDASKEVKEGDEISVRIIKLNPDERKIGLSMKNVKSEKDIEQATDED